MFLIPCVVLIASEETLPGKILALVGILAVGLVALGLTWRLGLSGLLAGAFLLTVFRIHEWKFRFVGQSLLAADIIYFFRQFAANLTILLRYPGIVSQIILAALVIPILFWVFYKVEKPLRSRGKTRTLALRLVITLVALFIIPATVFIIRSTQAAFFKPLWKPNAWVLISSSHNVLSTLIMSSKDMEIKIPEQHFADMQESRRLFGGEPSAGTASDYPDIILWHTESTFDPMMLAACNLPECQCHLYQDDAETVASGLLRVHCFGGASWTSEFSILTGLNHELFGAGGLYTHFTLAPRIRYSLPLLLKQQGYRTVALYPNARNFFNAYNAYRDYGFDEFYAPEDLGLPNNPDLITDQVMYEQMANILRHQDSRPIFIYVLTQFQHGPHDQPVERLPEPYRSLRIPDLSDKEQVNLANYLYRLSLTDAVITELENNFLKASGTRKTLFIHYGDHQPSFGGLMMSMAKRGLERFSPSLQRNLTKFSIKANFPTATREQHDYLDIAFIGSLILDIAGLPKDQYFSANSRLRQLCDGKYLDCDNQELLDHYHDYIFYDLGAIR